MEAVALLRSSLCNGRILYFFAVKETCSQPFSYPQIGVVVYFDCSTSSYSDYNSKSEKGQNDWRQYLSLLSDYHVLSVVLFMQGYVYYIRLLLLPVIWCFLSIGILPPFV